MEARFHPGRIRGSQALWWAVFVLCLVYGVFAVTAGLGLVEAEKPRAIEHAFVVHALAGGIALIAGALQFNAAIRARLQRVHRVSGRIYVGSVVLASLSGMVSAAAFEVGLLAKLSFALLGALWLASTLVGFRMILRKRQSQHRNWMIRSFALSLFFVSFSFWVPAVESFVLVGEAGYAVAVTLSWMVNLLVAEVLILRRKQGHTASL